MSLRIVGAIGLMSGLMAAWLFYADVRERQTSHAAISQMLLIVEPQRIDLGPLVIPAHRLVSIQFGDGGIKEVDENKPNPGS